MKCFSCCLRFVVCILSAAVFSFGSSPEVSGGKHGYEVLVRGERNARLSSYADDPFPMMSVVKFPLCVAVLHAVEEGELDLDQVFVLSFADLDPGTWSPMLKALPSSRAVSLRELVRWCLVESDNNACNFLFRLLEGPEEVQSFFVARYGESFPLVISCSEEAFSDRARMYDNHVTPRAMVRLLQDVHEASLGEGNILQPENARWLILLMEETPHGAQRLRAGLSKDVRLAHKTGSSGTVQGMTIALNDDGILSLPNGQVAYVVSFIRDSPESMEEMESRHARVGRECEKILRSLSR